MMMGQVMDKVWRDKKIKTDKKISGVMGDDDKVGFGALEAAAEEGGVAAMDLRGGKKRRKRKREGGEEEGEEGRGKKRVAS